MKNFRVTVPYVCYVTVEVTAEDNDEAVDIACDEIYIQGYEGGGQLIGVEGNQIIEVNNSPLEVEPFKIEVEEV